MLYSVILCIVRLYICYSINIYYFIHNSCNSADYTKEIIYGMNLKNAHKTVFQIHTDKYKNIFYGK